MGYKGYRVTSEFITSVITEGFVFKGHIEIQKGVPRDARLVKIDFDITRDEAVMWFEHPSYPAYPEKNGEVIVKQYHDPEM